MKQSVGEMQFAAWRTRLEAGENPDAIAGELLASPDFPPALWSSVWEALLASRRAERKRAGAFYTPEALTASLLAEAWKHLPPVPPGGVLTILDPACGTGNFLMAAAERWRAGQGGTSPYRLKLCGADLSQAALTIAAARLNHAFPGVETVFFPGDALWNDALPRADLAVGNPPFVPLTMLSDHEKARLRERFECASGRFNLFMLFLELCAKRILVPGGVGALVLPDRFLRNVQLARWRKKFTEHEELLAVVEPPRAARHFAAVVECVGVVWRRQTPAPEAEFDCGTRRLAVAGFPENLFAAPGATPEEPFPTAALGEIAAIRDGIIQSKVGDRLFRTEAPHKDCRKLLIGSDITPGEIHFRHRYADYRPAVMKREERRRGGAGLRMRSPEIFERPKILTRQTADRIIAAYDRAGEYFYANTLHGITPDPARVDPEYLLSYLNSRRAQEAYRALSGERGRPFAQVKIAILRRLPVPLPELAIQRQIASKVLNHAHPRGDETVASGEIPDDFDRAIAEFGAQQFRRD